MMMMMMTISNIIIIIIIIIIMVTSGVWLCVNEYRCVLRLRHDHVYNIGDDDRRSS